MKIQFRRIWIISQKNMIFPDNKVNDYLNELYPNVIPDIKI